jgi:PHS family inorganic phosphate transporter-like MFS transporter
MVVLSAFKESIQGQGETGHFNAVWRLILGVILVPALATLYQRLRLPESDRMTEVLKERKLRKAFQDVHGTHIMADILDDIGNKEASAGVQQTFQKSKLSALNEFVRLLL